MSFGGTVEMRAYMVRPPAPVLGLYEKMREGPVLDLPFKTEGAGFFDMAEYLFASAFHRHRVAACYNSFILPIQKEIELLAKRVQSDPRAADALYALGIRNVVVHQILVGRRRLRPGIPQPAGPHLVELGRAPLKILYALESPRPVEVGFRPLAVGASPPAAADASVPVTLGADVPATTDASQLAATIEVTFRNGTAATYRHPDPIVPTPLVARWYDDAGALVGEARVTTLLPLALAAGEAAVRSVTLPAPPAAGYYQLTLAPADAPDLVIAMVTVRVRGAAVGRPDGKVTAGPYPGAPAAARDFP